MANRFYDDDASYVDVGLKEARENGYYPSVTSILGVVDKPGVNNWLIRVMKDVCRRLALDGNEYDRKSFEEEVGKEFEEITKRGARLGSEYHKEIEELLILSSPTSTIPEETAEQIVRFKDRNKIKIQDTEYKFVNKFYGYAGTIDLVGTWQDGRPLVLDWKTQNTRGPRVKWYSQWPCQLASYAFGYFGHLDVDMVSVGISTSDPEIVKHKVWGDNEEWFNTFLTVLKLWRSPLCNNFPLEKT